MTYENEVAYHQRLIIGVTTFVEILGIASFALRLLARRLSGTRLWYDDYVMGAGLVFASIPGICNYVALRYGLGKHTSLNPPKDTENFLICFYVLQLSYVFTLPSVKISVLLFYHRLFPQKGFLWALWAMGVYLVLWFISSLLTVALQCLPIHSFWQPLVPHHCFDQVPYYIAQGSLNFVSDVLVVIMPMPILWGLQMPTRRKLGLVVVFLLGGFACAVSLCRIIALQGVEHDDILWTQVNPGLWSTAELEVLVVSANLPLMSPIIGRLRGKYRSFSERITPKDEESSSILKLSGAGARATIGTLEKTPHGLSCKADGGNLDNHQVVPSDSGIYVQMGLEQRVHGL